MDKGDFHNVGQRQDQLLSSGSEIQLPYPGVCGRCHVLVRPNDRYINDEAICTAVAGMLAAVGLDVDLVTVPVSNYWTELRDDKFDMYMLGWSPGTFDAEHPIRFLMFSSHQG